MATENLKSTQITNQDATPATVSTAGEGGPQPLRFVDSSGVTGTDGVVLGSTYQMVRIPSKAKVKKVFACLETTSGVTTFTADIGLYYSTCPNGNDGTKQSNVATVVSGTTGPTVVDADFFASAVALAAIVTPTDYTNESGTYTLAKRVQPIWQAAGLSADPGGMLDIVLTLTATASGAAKPYLYCEFAP
jgi:hypothetical protein